jgi:hypothetical protein
MLQTDFGVGSGVPKLILHHTNRFLLVVYDATELLEQQSESTCLKGTGAIDLKAK